MSDGNITDAQGYIHFGVFDVMTAAYTPSILEGPAFDPVTGTDLSTPKPVLDGTEKVRLVDGSRIVESTTQAISNLGGGSGGGNIDGGNPTSIYLIAQLIDGGGP